MARTKYRMNVRRFLNRKGFHSSAHIIAKVEDTSSKGDEKYVYPDIELVIADCSRSISLEFSDLHQADSRQNAMYKLDRLIADLEQFRYALRAEARLAAERERKEKVAKDKKKTRA